MNNVENMDPSKWGITLNTVESVNRNYISQNSSIRWARQVV